MFHSMLLHDVVKLVPQVAAQNFSVGHVIFPHMPTASQQYVFVELQNADPFLRSLVEHPYDVLEPPKWSRLVALSPPWRLGALR